MDASAMLLPSSLRCVFPRPPLSFETASMESKQGKVATTEEIQEDLLLCLDFLSYAKEEISMNHIVYRKPTANAYQSNASEHGIRVFSLTSGRAWHLKFQFIVVYMFL